MHRLIADLIDLMPRDGASWSRPDRERWLAALAAALDLLYEDGAAASTPVLDLRTEPVEATGRAPKHARPATQAE